MKSKILRILIFKPIIIALLLSSCGKSGDARNIPANMEERQRKNIEEGRGIKFFSSNDARLKGEFDFASSNELWRASLDTLDFMPLALANYSGGVIVTDWYNDSDSKNESVKISIRFLSNEVRSDALKIKVFYKNCSTQLDCKIIDKSEALSNELTNKILTKAALYEKEKKSKKKKK